MSTVLAAEKPALQEQIKILRVSSKRQITIPQKFYKRLGLGSEVECIMRKDELILRPVKIGSGGEFAEQILADLIKEGITGEALLAAFKERQARIRPAVKAMLAEAKSVAQGQGEYASYEDIFESEE